MVDKITVDANAVSKLMDNGSTLEEIVMLMEREKAAIKNAEKNGTTLDRPVKLYVVN